MNKLQITLAAFILMFTLQTNAQFSVSVNLGSRPQYHNHCDKDDEVRYYYLPEIEAYYDVNSASFIYHSPRGWIRTAYLPEYCRNYDVNRGYKVGISYTGRNPYVNFNYDRQKYYRNNGRNYREEYYQPRNRRNDYAAVSHNNRNENRSDYNRNDDNRWNNNRYQHEREREHDDRD